VTKVVTADRLATFTVQTDRIRRTLNRAKDVATVQQRPVHGLEDERVRTDAVDPLQVWR
jgi:hypothetical protein